MTGTNSGRTFWSFEAVLVLGALGLSYREESFLIMNSGVRCGLEEIRACYRQLNHELPNARYTYKAVLVEQDVGFVEWSADSDTQIVADGADSYIIRDGYIQAQTIHYTVVPKHAG